MQNFKKNDEFMIFLEKSSVCKIVKRVKLDDKNCKERKEMYQLK